MKLNFREVEDAATLSHGITPYYMPGSSSQDDNIQSYTRRSNQSGTINMSGIGIDHEAHKHSAKENGRKKGRCGLLFGSVLTYLFGIAVVLALPFAIPVAMKQMVRVVDGSHRWMRSDGRFEDGGREGLKDGFVQVEPISFKAEKEEPHMMNNDVGGVKKGGIIRPVREVKTRTKKKTKWNKYGVIRNGRLYISETFEARLNSEVVPRLVRNVNNLFGEASDICKGEGQVHFSFKISPHIEAELELMTKCGPFDSSCMIRPHVTDVRGLHVSSEEGGRLKLHYVTTEGGASRGSSLLGTLLGPLKVRLLDGSVMALRKSCNGGKVTNTRVISVREIKRMLKGDEEDSRDEDGDTFDVLRYNN